MAGTSGGTIDSGNHVASSSGILATSGRARKNRPIPADDPDDADEQGLDRGQPRHLRGRGADQPQRGQPLLATRGRQPGRGRDEDRDRDQGADDREHDHQDRRSAGGRGPVGVGSNAVIGDAPERLEGRRLEADRPRRARPGTAGPRHRSSRRPSRSGRRAGRPARSSAARRAPARRRPHPVRAARSTPGGVGGASIEPGDEDADERLARVDVDVRRIRRPRPRWCRVSDMTKLVRQAAALRAVVEGRQERQREQQDRRPDRDRERGQGQPDRPLPDRRSGRAGARAGSRQRRPRSSRPSRTMISRWA